MGFTMKLLSREFVKRLQKTLEPGFVVELQQVGDEVKIRKHPVDEANIFITPILTRLEGEVILQMTLKQTGEDPIPLPDVMLPKAYWITGIMGSRNQAAGGK